MDLTGPHNQTPNFLKRLNMYLILLNFKAELSIKPNLLIRVPIY